MPHGQPDYGLYTQKKTVYGLADLGEVAARLGSVCTYDRRGDVIWFDDFESGIERWLKMGPDAGESAVWSPERASNGGFCYKLSTAAIADNYVEVVHHEAYPVLSKIGFEVSFTYYDDQMIYLFKLNLGTTPTNYNAHIRYNATTEKIEIFDAGVWRERASGVELFHNTYLFNTMKLVVDFEAPKKYARLIFNEVEYDISDYTPRSFSPGTGPTLGINVRVTTEENVAKIVYIDNAIITQNEP